MISSLSSSCTILSSSSSSRPAVSFSRFSSFINSSAGARFRSSRYPFLVLCDSKLRGIEEVIDEKKTTSTAAAMVVSSQHEISASRTFIGARSEQDLLLEIQKESEAGRLPINVAQGMEELYFNYQNAVLQSEHPKADEIILSNMAVVLDRVFTDVQEPFQFSPYHTAVRKPFDYYKFGLDYIRPLIDFRCSFVGNVSIFDEIEKKISQGENIIIFSNHQTEADPAVISLLLESTNPSFGENMIFVAGDRVITDPLCKPFSIGRNLLCVYSKKHMGDDPELIDMKKRANTKSLKEMAVILRGGSNIIWIAPSGGRDRPDPETKEWFPAPFDASSVDNMRRLASFAGVPFHIYPMSMLCHDIMPPPQQVEKEIGEKRLVAHHGVGLSVGQSISYPKTSELKDSEEAKMEYTQLMYSSICEQYNVLNSAIHGKLGVKASSPTTSLTQPWE